MSEAIDFVPTYQAHGVKVASSSNGEAVGTCWICGKERHIYIKRENGVYHCKVCGHSGGVRAFFAYKAAVNAAQFKGPKAVALARDRGISTETMRAWGMGWDGYSYTIASNVFCPNQPTDLRRYQIGGKMLSTKNAKAGFIGKFNKDNPIVWICEGEWDGMALWEASKGTASVVTIPGSSAFPITHANCFAGKDIRLALDHDASGAKGTERIVKILTGIAKSIRHVLWPDNFAKGYDVRDHYKLHKENLIPELEKLLTEFKQSPSTADVVIPEGATGTPRSEVAVAYNKWFQISEMEILLDIIYGTCFANRLDGDPVWLMLVGPPGSAKTECLLPLENAPRTYSLSTLTTKTLISGSFGPDGSDPSLIPLLNGKVLVIKDFTTILSMTPTDREEIYSILRDAFDGKIAKNFAKGFQRAYYSRFGILAGVTPAIEAFSNSSNLLGERFLRYRLVGRDPMGAISAALEQMGAESPMRKELNEVCRKALTREVLPDTAPVYPQEMIKRLAHLSRVVALLRGVVCRDRFTQKLDAKPTTEIGTRVVKQIAKLGKGIAIFHEVKEITPEIYQTLCAVARGTIPDLVEEIVRTMAVQINKGAATLSIPLLAEKTHLPQNTLRVMVDDLVLLHVCERAAPNGMQHNYRLTDTILNHINESGIFDRYLKTARLA